MTTLGVFGGVLGSMGGALRASTMAWFGLDIRSAAAWMSRWICRVGKVGVVDGWELELGIGNGWRLGVGV